MVHIIELNNLVIERSNLLQITRLFSDQQGTCLLYSGKSQDASFKSLLFLFPFEFVQIHQGKQQRYHHDKCKPVVSLSLENPWDALKLLMPDLGKGNGCHPEWVGFFGYEMGAFSDVDKITKHFLADTPEAYWQRCAVVLSVDHRTKQGTVYIADKSECCFEDERHHWMERLSSQDYWAELIQAKIEDTGEEKNNATYQLAAPIESIQSYVTKIDQIKESIRDGDVYQVNLSQQFTFCGKTKPYNLFHQLTQINPAPFSAFMHLNGYTIVSSSPERFLSKSGNKLETRPIKGTAPRGATRQEDEKNYRALIASEKERAELLMITDLMRNDLGRISAKGSVQVPLVWGCEAYTNVYHLYSIVQSQMRNGLHPLDAIRACFPGGSITGCPKLNAMQTIAELEKRPRGIYTGSIGYFTGDGDFDLNIAIRTFVMTAEKISVQLGGGIVIDSDPIKEYQETLYKGQSIFKALGMHMN